MVEGIVPTSVQGLYDAVFSARIECQAGQNEECLKGGGGKVNPPDKITETRLRGCDGAGVCQLGYNAPQFQEPPQEEDCNPSVRIFDSERGGCDIAPDSPPAYPPGIWFDEAEMALPAGPNCLNTVVDPAEYQYFPVALPLPEAERCFQTFGGVESWDNRDGDSAWGTNSACGPGAYLSPCVGTFEHDKPLQITFEVRSQNGEVLLTRKTRPQDGHYRLGDPPQGKTLNAARIPEE